MGLFDALTTKPSKPAPAAEQAPDPAAGDGGMSGNRTPASARAKAVALSATPQDPASDAAVPKADGDKPGFLASHFGNPEAGAVYGVGNDYETEEQQIQVEKVSANQSLWYIGAFTLLVLLGYWFFT